MSFIHFYEKGDLSPNQNEPIVIEKGQRKDLCIYLPNIFSNFSPREMRLMISLFQKEIVRHLKTMEKIH